jgi:hypothetical protein
MRRGQPRRGHGADQALSQTNFKDSSPIII